MTGRIVSYNYKSTLEVKYWQKYLDRKLKKEEFFIIKQTESEHNMNEKIVDIYNVAKVNGLYVPQLTNLHGNCIFESLQYHELCDDIDNFRCGLAWLMMVFKDKKNFIPDQEMSMNELYDLDIDNHCVVFCRKKRRAYKYNFVTMCIDMAKNSSWTRLNTNLMFVAISVLLNLKIVILHNAGNINTIVTKENDQTKTIYLGLIDEIHYFPLAERTGHKIEDVCPKYVDSLKLFHQWAKGVAIMTGNVVYEDDMSDMSDSSDE